MTSPDQQPLRIMFPMDKLVEATRQALLKEVGTEDPAIIPLRSLQRIGTVGLVRLLGDNLERASNSPYFTTASDVMICTAWEIRLQVAKQKPDEHSDAFALSEADQAYAQLRERINAISRRYNHEQSNKSAGVTQG